MEKRYKFTVSLIEKQNVIGYVEEEDILKVADIVRRRYPVKDRSHFRIEETNSFWGLPDYGYVPSEPKLAGNLVVASPKKHLQDN